MTETKYCYRHPDRETGLSCSDCGRPICVDCMSVAPVGIRCPDHAGGKPKQAPRPVRSVQRTAARQGLMLSGEGLVTKAIVAANLLIYLITVAQGSGINDPGGELFFDWLLFGPAVAEGDWWRLISACFLHGSLLHLAFNTMALLWLAGPVEAAIGRARFVLLYLVSGLAGSAGALLMDPDKAAVGASGAIFGMLGAGLILEWRATGSLAGNYLTLIALNLAFSFAVPNISIGGHVGGLVGGILGAAVIVWRGRFREAWDTLTIAGVACVGVLSVVIAYWKVGGPT